MNKEQFLLAQLAQEAAEIAKAATKCMMFGSYNTNPETGVENVERLREELDDLTGTVNLLMDILPLTKNKVAVASKMQRVKEYQQLSIQLGCTRDR